MFLGWLCHPKNTQQEVGAIGERKGCMHFEHKTILIIGASGGLGSAIARAFAAQGADLALAARREFALPELPGAGLVTNHQADLTDPVSLAALRDAVLSAHGRLDGVINATGFDARKPLAAHTLEDFQRSLNVNLLGAMLLTQTFVPVLENGVILHLGGFADGRLAFPFYSADAASRSGLRAFIESTNRELALARRPVVVSFFSPSPADTEAERPFHPLWKQMGTQIVPVEKVAGEVLQTVLRRQKVHVMGGFVTRLFAALNAVFPDLADALMMKSYGEMMNRFFNGKGPDDPRTGSGWRSLGIFLVVYSFVAYGLLLAVPFVPLAAAGKVLLSSLLVGSGEVTFWVGGALLGKEVVGRYKKYLNPLNWFCRSSQ